MIQMQHIHMKKLFITACLCAATIALKAQTLQWAYSFQNQVVQESVTEIASNGSDRFAIIGMGNPGISMDPINHSPLHNSTGNFVAAYDPSAQIQWVQPTVGFAFGVEVASNGAVYVCGGFSGTKDFDPSGANFPLTATGYDSYLQKFNPDGTFAWAAAASAEGNPSEIEILADGRIIVAGRSDVDATVTLSNTSTVMLFKGIYILEFSAAGSLTNAYSISVPAPAGYGYVYDLSSDASNNIYLGGALDGIADFDLGAGTANNTPTNAYDGYIVKYNPSFQLQWFRQFGDHNTPTGWDKVRGLAIDAAGNVYAGGEFTWTTDFDPANPGTQVLVSDPFSQVPSGFLMQYSPSGALNWVHKIGNNNGGVATESASVSITDIALQNNTLYAAMEGWGYWDVDPSGSNLIIEVGAVASPGIGFGKYTTAGNLLSAFSVDTNATSTGLTLVGMGMLGTDQLVTGGMFNKKLDFDPTGTTWYLATDSTGSFYQFDNDIFIAKYSFGGITATASPSAATQLQAHPNPFDKEIWLQNLPAGTPATLSIYDAQGKQVHQAVPAPGVPIATQFLPAGYYTLVIATKEGKTTHIKMLKTSSPDH